MNRNTKGNFNEAKRQAAKGNLATTFDIPRVLDGVGEGTVWGTYGPRTFNFKSMPRLSRKDCPKVANKGKRSRQEIEQVEILDIEAQEIKKLDLQRIKQLNPAEIIEVEVIEAETIPAETIPVQVIEPVKADNSSIVGKVI